jgi:homocitrate synthase NifV
VGEGIFEHESGIHCAGIIKNPKSYQPFLPEEIGKKGFCLRIGYHSGRSSIMNALKSMGIRIGQKEAGLLVEQVRKMAKRKKRGLSREELVRIYKESKSPTVVFSRKKHLFY